MELINRFGQRNVAKVIFALSLILAFTAFYVKNGMVFINSKQVWFGILLLSLPSFFLMMAALKSKEFRMLAILISLIILISNMILFSLRVPDFLFIVTLFEIVATFMFFMVALRSKARLKG